MGREALMSHTNISNFKHHIVHTESVWNSDIKIKSIEIKFLVEVQQTKNIIQI